MSLMLRDTFNYLSILKKEVIELTKLHHKTQVYKDEHNKLLSQLFVCNI